MKRLLPTFMLLLVLTGVSRTAVSQADTCPALIDTAVLLTERACTGMMGNEACYGHSHVEAQPQPAFDAFDFDEAGERADLTALRSLRASALDIASGQWGVAMMKVRARQPGMLLPEPLTFLLFGDSMVENRVPADAVPITIASRQNINLRLTPDAQGYVLGTLRGGQTVTARGRLADQSWLYVENEDGQQGWIIAGAVAAAPALRELAILQPDNAHFGAMQAFTLQTGSDQAACESLPESGLLVQTPDGIAEISLWVNEVKISLGSTAFIQAQPGDRMTVAMLEGHARIEAFGVTSIVAAGAQVSVPLNEAGVASGPPQRPTAIDAAALEGLPVGALEREIPPLDTIPVYIPPEQPGQSGSAPGQQDCPGSSCDAPGQQNCPGNSCAAPGHGNTPPGQGGVPPGQGGNPPPGQGDCPGNSCAAPGHGNTPPGQGGIPPGQSGGGNGNRNGSGN